MNLAILLLLRWFCEFPTSRALFVNTAAPKEEYPEDFFPPLADADDIEYFFSTYDLDGLHWALTNIFQRSSRNPNLSSKDKPLPGILVSRGGGDSYTSEYKLRHDLMQAEYLVQVLDDSSTVEYLLTNVIPIYQAVLQNIPPLEQLDVTKGLYAFTQQDYELGIATVYNKALYMTTADELNPSWRVETKGLLNSRLDWDQVQNQWFGEDNGSNAKQDSHNILSSNGVIVIDDLLNGQTLDLIRKLLLRNTHW